MRRIFLDITLGARQFRGEQHPVGIRPAKRRVHGRRDIRERFRCAHVDNKPPANAPKVPERVYKPEKHRNGCHINRGAVAFRDAVLHDTHAVAFLEADRGRNDRIIPVIIAPIRHSCHPNTEAALIQTVGVEVRVVGRLRVPGAENNAHRVLYNRAGDIPIRLPALASLAGDRTEIAVNVCRRGHSELGFLRCAIRKIGVIEHAAVTAAVPFIGGNNRAELLLRAVDHPGTQPRNTARRNENRLFARDRLERDRLDGVVALFPCRIVVCVPAPHTLPLRAVELGRAAVLVTGRVCRVELAPYSVVGHEVTTEPQFFRQLFECRQAAIIPGSDRGRVRLVPIPARDRVACRLNGFGKVHAPRLAALVLHGYRHVRELARRPRQLVDTFCVLKRRKHQFYVVFLLIGKCHCYNVFMLKVCCCLPSQAARLRTP